MFNLFFIDFIFRLQVLNLQSTDPYKGTKTGSHPQVDRQEELFVIQSDEGQGLQSGCRHRAELTGNSVVCTTLIATADNSDKTNYCS